MLRHLTKLLILAPLTGACDRAVESHGDRADQPPALISSNDLAAALSTPAAQEAGHAFWNSAAKETPASFAQILASRLTDRAVTIDQMELTSPRQNFSAGFAVWQRLSERYATVEAMLSASGFQLSFTTSPAELRQALRLPEPSLAVVDHAWIPTGSDALITYNWFSSPDLGCGDIYEDMQRYYHPTTNAPLPAYSYADRVTINLRNQGTDDGQSATTIAAEWSKVANHIDSCSLANEAQHGELVPSKRPIPASFSGQGD